MPQEQAIESDNGLACALVELLPVPERVADRGRLRIKSHIPAEIDIRRCDQRLDFGMSASRCASQRSMTSPSAASPRRPAVRSSAVSKRSLRSQ